jgi:hypothetical protein
VEENVYVAEPPESAKEEVAVVPSIVIVRVPVGMVVLELEADVTLMVMTSLAPEAGVVVAADSAVVVATGAGPTITVSVPVEAA